MPFHHHDLNPVMYSSSTSKLTFACKLLQCLGRHGSFCALDTVARLDPMNEGSGAERSVHVQSMVM